MKKEGDFLSLMALADMLEERGELAMASAYRLAARMVELACHALTCMTGNRIEAKHRQGMLMRMHPHERAYWYCRNPVSGAITPHYIKDTPEKLLVIYTRLYIRVLWAKEGPKTREIVLQRKVYERDGLSYVKRRVRELVLEVENGTRR